MCKLVEADVPFFESENVFEYIYKQVVPRDITDATMVTKEMYMSTVNGHRVKCTFSGFLGACIAEGKIGENRGFAITCIDGWWLVYHNNEYIPQANIQSLKSLMSHESTITKKIPESAHATFIKYVTEVLCSKF